MRDNTIAFVFPGQGSQQLGMLAAAHDRFAVVRDAFEEASDVLGYNVWSLVASGPQEALNLTETTQPILLTCSVALWRAWGEASGAVPVIMAGHSLGEFSALVCAGALEFTDAVKLVRKRGEFMQAAVPAGQGAMAAIIGVEDSEVTRICQQVAQEEDDVVSAVNFNSPGQVVIAGRVAAVDLAIIALKEAGAKRALPLPVSAPFHTQLMKPAGEHLAEVIAGITISSPKIPVVHNVNATVEPDPEKIRELLVEQIYSPVQWTASMGKLIEAGATNIIECGPGKVLSGLSRRIEKTLDCYSLENPEVLLETAAELK
jgi:[acyl-carrier-protein] S-malonyltransferase